MKFWGVEVKSGQSFDVNLGGRYLRLKQVSLGEIEGEAQESVLLHIIVDGKKIVLATLKPRRRPQKLLSSVLDKDFTISHTLRNGSVYFVGSVTRKPYYEHGLFLSDKNSDDDEEEETAKKEGNKVEEASPATEATHTSPTTEECMDNMTRFPYEEGSFGYHISPTEECMDIVTRFPGYEEGSLGYFQALHVFLKKPARENFMVPRTPAIRMEFLKMMIEKDNLLKSVMLSLKSV